jgi:transposase
MTLTSTNLPYEHFIGIDIAKKSFVAACLNEKKTTSFSNDLSGFQKFCDYYKDILRKSFITLEMTGYYEMECAKYLVNQGFDVHRAHGYQIKNYTRSLGIKGKTDSSDAQVLAIYGKERHIKLMLFKCPTKKETELRMLLSRRSDLVKMSVQEKNRLQAPGNILIKDHIENVLSYLKEQIQIIESKIENLFEQDEELKLKAEVAKTITGIGPVLSKALVIGIPELGKIDRRSIASLVGVAPHPKNSGSFTGIRSTSRGREEIKRALCTAALSAARSKGEFGDFYRNLRARGKKPMVAVVALMRKILVVLNAKIRDFYKTQKDSQGLTI